MTIEVLLRCDSPGCTATTRGEWRTGGYIELGPHDLVIDGDVTLEEPAWELTSWMRHADVKAFCASHAANASSSRGEM